MAGDVAEQPSFDLGIDEVAVRRCWYCGSGEGPFETEHQVPVSRGGKWRDNIVWSDARCNDLKGKLTLDEFRAALVLRLDLPEVVFWGESKADRPATPIRSVHSLLSTRNVVRLDPLVYDELERAVLYRRAVDDPGLTKKDAASAYITDGLAADRERLLNGGRFPAPARLFADEEPGIVAPHGLSQTPRVVQPSDVTKVSGAVLDLARHAVSALRGRGRPDLGLRELIDELLTDGLARLQAEHPGLLDGDH